MLFNSLKFTYTQSLCQYLSSNKFILITLLTPLFIPATIITSTKRSTTGYKTMNKKTLALALLTVLSSTTAHSESLNGIDEVSVLFGGYSKHFTQDADWYEYNQSHHIKGIMINNKYTLATFENSYYNQSVLVAYNWHLWDAEWNDITFGASVSIGLVTGYKSYSEMGIAYLGGGLSVNILPTFSIGYNITNNLTFSFDSGILPASEGVVFTNNFRLTYKF